MVECERILTGSAGACYAGAVPQSELCPFPNSSNGRSNMPKFPFAAFIARTWRESPFTDSSTVICASQMLDSPA